ncbi:MAG: undecaprenyldiphospho-muramoylpentapeptide beta-N-acetylglucosaminyltransferase [Oscillospiraceae bacterium]|nr:undecaprenyldiphospho-muramoylpentapeptide beta-N-acetylglucosaminyltransferase [Oscillospiraceae bacterium]
MKLVFTCGGTGGHIYPAIAVANMFRQREKDCEILFIGSDGMEQDIVPRAGFPLKSVKVSGFQRKLTPKALCENLRTFFTLRSSMAEVKKILQEFSPDCIIGTGGYASFPALKMGAKLGIPTVVHESNAVPGLATRLVADQVDRILVAFPQCRENYRNPEKVVVTGTPTREEFLYTSREKARKDLQLDERPMVLSCWGSLGAREMNKKIADFMVLESQEDRFQHIHATGSYGWRWMPDHVRALGLDLEKHPNLRMQEYIYDMPSAMAATDLMICRAGAATISELTVSSTPAIIVPSPNVADNHQEKNARVLEQAGAAVVIREQELTAEKLLSTVEDLLQNPEKLIKMRKALTTLAVVDATERIYTTIRELCHSH